MGLNQELQDALLEEMKNIQETEGFKLRFAKLIENYMDGMGSEGEIADVISLITLAGEEYEN